MPDAAPHYFQPTWIETSDERIGADVCVYGGTAAGVIAAAAAAGRGKSVILLHPGEHLGGMTTGGLGRTDAGRKYVIGGMARRFYRLIGERYGEEEVWHFEPHVAAAVINELIEKADVPVRLRQYLAAVEMDGQRIVGATMLGGLHVRAKMFIDATYEGDLLAKAGVSYAVGREANGVYGETINGVEVRHSHQFRRPAESLVSPVDPFVTPGDPASGVLPHVNMQDAAPRGSGDHRIQAYCFRVCMTDREDLRVDWRKPEGFDAAEYVLATRWYNAEKNDHNETLKPDGELKKFDRLFVKHKTDTNNHGPVSSDHIGMSYAWPEADYAVRERIFQQHLTYQQGLYWFMANDPSIPRRYREAFSKWGLARDEFTATGHWPHQLYVREGRRMISDYVVSEQDCQHQRQAEDPVGMGSYNMDSHNCQRIVRDGRVLNEGDVQRKPAGPYGVSYRSIIPARGEAQNLIVPVCLSASHIAYGSVRMEPVFMALGESAATAACLALDAGRSVQDLPYPALRAELEKADQVVEWNGKAG